MRSLHTAAVASTLALAALAGCLDLRAATFGPGDGTPGEEAETGGGLLPLSVKARPARGPAPLDVEFRLNVPGAGPDLPWAIDFGDGATRNGTGDASTVRHTYTRIGTHHVALAAGAGASLTQVALAITVLPAGAPHDPGEEVVASPPVTPPPAGGDGAGGGAGAGGGGPPASASSSSGPTPGPGGTGTSSSSAAPGKGDGDGHGGKGKDGKDEGGADDDGPGATGTSTSAGPSTTGSSSTGADGGTTSGTASTGPEPEPGPTPSDPPSPTPEPTPTETPDPDPDPTTSSSSSAEPPPNAPPQASLDAQASSPTAPADVTYTVDASDPEDDDLAWSLAVDGSVLASGSGGDLPRSVTQSYSTGGNHTAVLTVSDGAATVVREVVVAIAEPPPAEPEPTGEPDPPA